MNIYYDPAKFGLEIVGEVEWISGYEFDKHVVWYQPATGRYLWGTDSGCSCPNPFELQGIGDLGVLRPGIWGVEDLKDILTGYDKVRYRNGEPWESLDSRAHRLVELLLARVTS